jgi:hypothetical protein
MMSRPPRVGASLPAGYSPPTAKRTATWPLVTRGSLPDRHVPVAAAGRGTWESQGKRGLGRGELCCGAGASWIGFR